LAIRQLLNEVPMLADGLYHGDVGKAFQIALALDFTQEEIAGYTNYLVQVEPFSVAYQARDLALASIVLSARDMLYKFSLFDADTHQFLTTIGDLINR
jgi:hypothetical protein